MPSGWVKKKLGELFSFDDADNVEALEALEKLYSRDQNWGELLGVYRSQIPLTQDGGKQMWTEKRWKDFQPRLKKWMTLFEELGTRHGLTPDAGFMLGGKAPGIADVVTATLWSVMAERFGSRVRMWTTINEPWVATYLGHAIGIHAPGIADAAVAARAHHHLLLAHAVARQRVRAVAADAQVGIALNMSEVYPAVDTPASRAAAALAFDQLVMSFLEPLRAGRYPGGIEGYSPRWETGEGIVAGEDLVSRSGEARGRRKCGHAARKGDGRRAAFELRELPLERRARRIRRSGVVVFAELERRGAPVVVLGRDGPALPGWLTPVTAIVPGQLLAWRVATLRGVDVDHPGALSKVTLTH